jgi:hypothetical protein
MSPTGLISYIEPMQNGFAALHSFELIGMVL